MHDSKVIATREYSGNSLVRGTYRAVMSPNFFFMDYEQLCRYWSTIKDDDENLKNKPDSIEIKRIPKKRKENKT